MRNSRQIDLQTVVEKLRRLGVGFDQFGEIDQRVVEMYAKLEKVDRLDLLEDALAALASASESDDIDPDIDLGIRA